MDELEKLLDEAESMARAMVASKGEALPMFICQKPEAERFGIGFDPAPTPIQRRLQALEIGKVMRARGVVRYVVIYEADLSLARPAAQPMPSNEAVFLEGHEIDAEKLRMLWIERDGREVTLSPSEATEGLAGGTYTGLLTEPTSAAAPTVH